MNCNKKSHFDGMTLVPWQGGFGYISVCQGGEELRADLGEKEDRERMKERERGGTDRERKRERERKSHGEDNERERERDMEKT